MSADGDADTLTFAERPPRTREFVDGCRMHAQVLIDLRSVPA